MSQTITDLHRDFIDLERHADALVDSINRDRQQLAADHVSGAHRNGHPPVLSARLLRHDLTARPRFVRLADGSKALEYAFRAEGDERHAFVLRLDVAGDLFLHSAKHKGERVALEAASVLHACASAVLASHLFEPALVAA